MFKGSLALCLVAARSPVGMFETPPRSRGGMLETPPRGHVTIYIKSIG